MKQAFALRECRFTDPQTGKYLGFCRNGGPTAQSAELHPIAMPFVPAECCVEKGPFRHQYGRSRK